VFRPGVDACPSCGEAVERKEPRKIEVVDGDLERVDVEAMRKEQKKQQGQSRDIFNLVLLGVRRKMKNPSGWAAHVYCSREGRKPTKEDYLKAKSALRKIEEMA